MTHIYIALVDTPGFFASLIRRFLKQRYVHVVIAADMKVAEAYSVGRRNPAIPILAGFEREDKYKILRVFPKAYYRICELECTSGQKKILWKSLKTIIKEDTISIMRFWLYPFLCLDFLFT